MAYFGPRWAALYLDPSCRDSQGAKPSIIKKLQVHELPLPPPNPRKQVTNPSGVAN